MDLMELAPFLIVFAASSILLALVDGHEVVVVPYGIGQHVERYNVTSESVLPRDTKLAAARHKDAYGDAVPMTVLWTGDPGFDRRVAIQVPSERAITSYLSAQARAVLAAAVVENVTIGHHEIRGATTTEDPGAPEIEALLSHIVAVASAFGAQPLSEAERLAHNALSDPLQAVRDKNAKLLFDHHSLAQEVVGVAEAWATFEDPEVWVAAARVLGPDQRLAPVLRVLAEVARGQRLNLNQLVAARLLAETQPSAARLRALTPSLDPNEPITHGTAAAVTLGMYADIDVVGALRAAIDRLGRAADEAIAGIQSRHAGTPGQLSIVADADASGGLTEVQTSESGAVSLVGD